ncbi:MAG: hypothetical protein V3T92_04025, partial [Anaerolineae bacterium]
TVRNFQRGLFVHSFPEMRSLHIIEINPSGSQGQPCVIDITQGLRRLRPLLVRPWQRRMWRIRIEKRVGEYLNSYYESLLR